MGQLRGHTIENKIAIFEELKKCGFEYLVVASFAHMTRVDDLFVKHLKDKGEDFDKFFAFSEVINNKTGLNKNGTPNKDLPIGLKKMKQLGMKNPIFEIDLNNCHIDWDRFTIHDMCKFLLKRITYAHEKLSPTAKVIVNIRDLPSAMLEVPHRVLTMVEYLSKLPEGKRPFALIFEEVAGNFMTDDIGACCTAVKNIMKANGWNGKLLVHVHERWGFADAVQMECLQNGADGVWCSVCIEGAATGHSCSAVTIMNLVRLGNKHVMEKFNCQYLRKAAIAVTEITTGEKTAPKQVVYGERALDVTFDLGSMGAGAEAFDMADFFGVKAPTRISTMATPDMIRDRLCELFGQGGVDCSDKIAKNMQKEILKDLTAGIKEEYMSAHGVALLYDRAGGKLTEQMSDVMAKVELNSHHANTLIKEVRAIWDEWDIQDKVQGDDCLEYNTFYNGFMAPYFGCYSCEDTKKALSAIDMDHDNLVDWKELLVYLKWAMNTYPNIKDTKELLDVTFQRGLIPAMRDEMIKKGQLKRSISKLFSN